MFSVMYTRETTFVASYLPPWLTKPQNRAYSSRKEFAPRGANSFLEELIPVEK